MLGKALSYTLVAFDTKSCYTSAASAHSNSVPWRGLNPACQVPLKIHSIMSWERIGLPLHRMKKWNLHSVSQAEFVSLADEEKNSWEECKQILSALSFTTEQADVMLGKAFGWIDSPYWGEERSKEIPSCMIVNQVLGYLKNLGLSDDDLHKLLKKFPEVLGCSLHNEIKPNVHLLEKEWGISGKPLRTFFFAIQKS